MAPTTALSAKLKTNQPTWPILYIWITALIGLCEAEWTRVHVGLIPDWFSMSFYFFIPAALWTFSIPLLQKLCYQFSLSKFAFRNWLLHLFASLIVAVVLKFLALSIDFSIKYLSGIMNGSFVDFLYQVRFLFFTSIIDNIVIYWLLLLILHFTKKEIKLPVLKINYPKSLPIKADDGLIRVMESNILYIEAFGNYLKVHTLEGVHCCRGTIKSMLSRLAPSHFLQVHRSFIINVNFVDAIKPGKSGNYQIATRNNGMIPTGRQYRNSIKGLLNQFQQPDSSQ